MTYNAAGSYQSVYQDKVYVVVLEAIVLFLRHRKAAKSQDLSFALHGLLETMGRSAPGRTRRLPPMSLFARPTPSPSDA